MYSSIIIRMSLCALMCIAVGIPSVMGANDKTYQTLVEQARDLSLSGHYEDAILTYREVVKLKPGHASVNIELATLLRDTGNIDGAQRVLKTAIDSDVNDADVHLLYGELIEAFDEKLARKHYQAAIDADPASPAAQNALSNLETLDEIVRDGVNRGPRAHIEWSATEDDGQIDNLATQIDGEWCLEIVDIYHREAGMCVSDPLAGDIAVIDDHPRIQLRIDGDRRHLISPELSQVTEVIVPDSPITSVDVATGDHYEVHTVNFGADRYMDFNISNGASQCLQIQQFDRGRELLNCPNAYTFCQCSR